ncbi:hypothetical protein AAFC00_003592 [Neodothiora populina]|uniref:Cytochrome P450 n=1 Tax=Neodothiora populina TaxID=2781224 RepID=A0ABR3PEZ5_9PEZI
MALASLLETASLATSLGLIFVLSIITIAIYRLIFHPLSSIPGPFACRLTSFWTYYHSYVGDECTLITQFHDSYGPVIRVAPNEICIADGSCLGPIYNDKGGFAKADCYRNFDIEGFASLFSELVKETRAPKAKSVLPLFSTGNLRQGERVLMRCVDTFVQRVRSEKDEAKEQGAVNILNLSRSLALDAVTAYLFGRSYGGLEEEREGKKETSNQIAEKPLMSASEFVDAFVGVGRFFYLPNWIFVAAELGAEKFFGTKATEDSMTKVDDFVKEVVNQADPEDGSYPGRMLKAGLTPEEVVAQCKDLMFAGTDSSGMNLSTLCWQLAKNPDVYAKLKLEISQAEASVDPASLPYLRSCIREALRLSMANPTRLPRVVPPGGWVYHCASNDTTYHFPAGTLVSAQLHTLHHNPAVFSDPMIFRPERWLETSAGCESREQLALMNRDFIPFGLGSRQCIARNLAMMELTLAGRAVAQSGVLDGAKGIGEKVEIVEWFNSRVKGEEILLRWD